MSPESLEANDIMKFRRPISLAMEWNVRSFLERLELPVKAV